MTTARSDQRWAGTARPHGASAVAAAVATLVLTGAAAGCGGPARSAPTSTRPVPTTVPTTTTTTLPSAVPTTVPTPPVATPGWSPVATVLPPAGGITSLDCLSDVLCVAAGGGVNHADAADAAGAGVTLSWDGAGWSPPSVWFPAPADGPVAAPARPAVACAYTRPRCPTGTT